MNMANYEGSPATHFESMFNQNFAGFLGGKPGMSYDYVYSQDGNRNPSVYCESPDNVPACLYAPPSRGNSMCGSPCMMTPLSPYASISPSSTVSHYGNESYGIMRELGATSPPCRRRLNFTSGASVLEISLEAPVAVAKRNERERNRVKLINMTFQKLRQHLPLMNVGPKGKSRKLSKVQTLRSAIDYIRDLQQQVHNKQQPDHTHVQQRSHSKLHEEFLQMNYCNYSSEEDNMAEDDDYFDDTKSVYGKYSPAQSMDDMCTNSATFNNTTSRTGFINNNNNNNNSNNNNNNDDNNNVSRSASIRGGGGVAMPEACPSILSFGDEIKFIVEGHRLTSGKHPV